MDEIRSDIWDFLSQTNGPQSFSAIAQRIMRDTGTIRAAVDHEWFKVTGELVSIAYCEPERPTSGTDAASSSAAPVKGTLPPR